LEPNLIANLIGKIRGAGASREVLVKRVADALREQITSRQLSPGARLISEVALAQRLEISRPTLREAMRILAREGFIDIKHGVGAFVADEQRLIWSRLDSIRSLTDLIRSVGGKPEDRRVTVQRTAAPKDVAEAIEIAPQTPVCLIKRVRLIDGAPLAVANEYIPLAGQTEDFGRLKAFAGGSLFKFLGERCGVMLARSNVVIAAVRADERARLLEVRAGTPVLLLRETHFLLGETHCDLAGKPVLFTVNHHNSNLVQFILTRAGLPS
jgi:DNA-binding GntR family transcriptional regulator